MIPRILHHLWKDADVPPRLAAFRATWRRLHPDWEHRLWTDADLRAFVAREAPDFLPVYDAYEEPIRRADAARYLILQRLGGLYVDLDFECLKPLDPLLAGCALAVGLEPDSHLDLDKTARTGLTRLLCPSLIASVPGHAFWNDVVAALHRSAGAADVLDATGPYLLTRTYEAYTGPDPVTLLPARLVYPADKVECLEGRLFDIERWERLTRDAYALHHWDGSWIPGMPAPDDGRPAAVSVSVTGPAESPVAAATATGDGTPLVSCLMATRDRTALALLAIESFRRQTYANRELVIVDDGAQDTLARAVATLADPRIRLVRPQDPQTNLGRARNRAVDLAAGAYVCQWDDDDLYDPLRLEMQMEVLQRTGAHACLLNRWMVWWPGARRLAVSRRRPWEGSLLCEKAVLPRYPELARGEDTPVVERLLHGARVAHLDEPRLYLYVVHGRNTFPSAHFDEHWQAADPRWEGERYGAVLTELAKRLPLSAYPQAIAAVLDERARAVRAQRPVEALALWDEALAADPRHGPARLGRGWARLDLGRFAEAEADFAELARRSPDDPAGAISLAEAAARQRDWASALARWRRVVALAPASSHAFVGTVTALVERGRLDEAEALARRRGPAMERTDAVLALATVLQRRQRGAELAALLDANRDLAAANAALRALHFQVLQAQGDMAGARAAVSAAPTTGTVLGDLVEAAYAHGPAAVEGRRRLYALWRAHGTGILTPDLLGLVAQAIGEAEGDTGVHALFDAVEALAPVDERTVRLRLLAVFEGLRHGRGDGDAVAALRRTAAARDPRAPMGHWDEAVRRFADGFERLRARFPDFPVDSGWRRDQARAVTDRILDAHRSARPFALIRLGDGEGNFLPYPPEQEEHAGPDRDATQCIWWGAPRLDAAGAAAMGAALVRAVRNADVVGVPDLSRLCYGLPVPTPPFLFRSWHDFRGLLVILHHLSQRGDGALFSPAQTITSCHIHADLAAWGEYERLFASVRRVSLITCHPALPQALERRFGLAVGQVLRIPHEARYAAQFGYADAGPHYPDAFRALERDLTVREPGEVFLVAAGFLGKLYADRIRALGGIALDVGSVVDHWCGFTTRSLHFVQRYAAAPEPPAPAPAGVTVFGHFSAGIGLGVAASGLLDALRAAGIPFTAHDLDDPDEPADEPAPHPVTIVHTNPDQLAIALAPGRGRRLRDAMENRPCVGVWAWESPTTAPAGWAAAATLFAEIWAPGPFAADALRRIAPVPVAAVTHVVAPAVPAPTRADLGLPDGAFLFAFVFDDLSGFARKNPVGLVEAFRRAFPQPDPATILLIKARSLSPDSRALLEAAIAGHPSIRLHVGEESRERTLALIAGCDAYVSLHRAEGFGLTVAEALAFGRPVIATACPGMAPLLSDAWSFPVPGRPVTLERAEGCYPAGTVWTEPDLDAAAALMRAVRGDPGAARARGRRAADHVRATLSPHAVGAVVRERVQALAARAAEGPPTVLVLTPVRNARRHLPAYLAMLERLDHPPDRLSLAFLEGGSDDGSHAFLAAELPRLRRRFRRVELLQHDPGVTLPGPRWAPEIQRPRRAAIARARNRLLQAALRDETWVLWIDADVIDAPPDTLRRLLATGGDVVVPHCVRAPGGPTFDLNTFRIVDAAVEADPAHVVDGLVQPPRGAGRRYLDSFRGRGMVPVDGVGGTMLLVRADRHRDGLVFPPAPYRGYIETEGLAMMARDMGITCLGLPDLEIRHAPD
ncbi:glycosyltransferase [Azospirillum halopraeferens]|uniref:glycosyltransferase n=1 Tax=Azospirillum halopraeferens TaxID=34010 RepID=UPI000427EE75|nr:glycosyltransferase [Azospirillum halopraeferens]